VKKTKIPTIAGGSSKKYLILVISFFVLLLLIKVYREVKSSLFLNHQERINILWYGDNSRVFSLGINDNTHYFFSFAADWKVKVPGCYGEYRTGALGKLAGLEKKDDILLKTYSHTSSIFINYYFYPSDVTKNIYFGTEQSTISFPQFSDIFFSRSNASFLDKVYIYAHLIGIPEKTVTVLKSDMIAQNKSGLEFQHTDFADAYKGFFYQKQLRNENQTVQIVYKHSYQTADGLSRIIEGEGIRVVDITQGEPDIKKCKVLYNASVPPASAKVISHYFSCELKKGDTDIYDIILVLGDKEKEWEICK
jgi:hypothetical protein